MARRLWMRCRGFVPFEVQNTLKKAIQVLINEDKGLLLELQD